MGKKAICPIRKQKLKQKYGERSFLLVKKWFKGESNPTSKVEHLTSLPPQPRFNNPTYSCFPVGSASSWSRLRSSTVDALDWNVCERRTSCSAVSVWLRSALSDLKHHIHLQRSSLSLFSALARHFTLGEIIATTITPNCYIFKPLFALGSLTKTISWHATQALPSLG